MTFSELGIKLPSTGGPKYYITCPKCKGERSKGANKPCLTVWNEELNKGWNCNHCGWKGNLSEYNKFEKVYQKSRMPAAKAKLFSKEIQDWLDTKQLNAGVALDLGMFEYKGVKAVPDGVDADGKEKVKWEPTGHQEVGFPAYRRGTLVNVMYRRIHLEQDGKQWSQLSSEYGTESCFWGWDDLELTQPTHHFPEQTHKRIEVIITEGHTDRITWVQSGYKNVISIPMGAPIPNAKNLDLKLAFLRHPYVTEAFKAVTRFYIAMDGDEAGASFKEVLANELGRDRCFYISYPFGYKDSNEVYAGDAGKKLNPHGKSGINDLYKNAKPVQLKGMLTVESLEPYFASLREKGFERGMLINETVVDKYLSVIPGMVWGITGVPGHGKSSWLRWYLVEIAKQNPTFKVGMYTPESSPDGREYAQLMEVYSQKVFQPGHHNQMSRDQEEKAKAWVKQRFFIVNPTQNNYMEFVKDPNAPQAPKGLSTILNYMKYLKQTQGISAFVIDAWNKIDHDIPKWTKEEVFLPKQLDYVLEFCQENNMTAFIVAHPVKMENGRGGNVQRPSLYNIKGVGWSEKVHVGIVIYRKKYKKSGTKDEDGDDEWVINPDAPTEVHVEKIKQFEIGEEGKFEMWMDRNNGESFSTRIPTKVTSRNKKIVLEPSEAVKEVPKEEKNYLDPEDIPF